MMNKHRMQLAAMMGEMDKYFEQPFKAAVTDTPIRSVNFLELAIS